jgi:hypothetical protein
MLGRGKEAVSVLEEGLVLTRELKNRNPALNYWDTRESSLMRWLAWAKDDLHQADEAVTLAERDWKGAPSSLPGQTFVVQAYRVRAHVAAARRNFATARASLDQAGAIAEKWAAATGHEVFLAHCLSNYYQSRVELAHSEKDAAAEREWMDKIGKLWREWPEQGSYTRMRQGKPLLKYPW